jgi:spore maturation protein CgeB
VSSAQLERNLSALASAGSDLAQRLTWPTRSHLARAPSGQLLRKGMPISLPPDQVAAAAAELAGEGPLALLGLGDAELVRHLLHESRRPLIAWDRDPWVVRAALAEHDLGEALASRRLALALGVDLLDLLAQEPAPQLAWHPLARASYALEVELVAAGPRERRVALGVDRLLCDELAAALRSEGHAVVPIDLEGWSIEELAHAIERARPAFVMSINYVWGLSEFCRAHGKPYLCWEIDPSTERLPRVEGPTGHCAVFSYRRAHVDAFRRAGFARVQHLPLAADPERRRPLALSPAERERFAAPIAFVGSSLAPEARRARHRLDQLFADWDPGRREQLAQALERALRVQRADFARYTLEAALRSELGDFIAALERSGEREDPIALAAQISAAEKRLCYLGALARSGTGELWVWGDDGWSALASSGAQYRGYAGLRHELTRIYSGAAIHIDIGRLYQSDIVTLRVFEVLACQGFLIAEHGADLAELFEVGRELETYSELAELIDKVRHYAARPELRRTIAERGRRAVEERHSVRARVRAMLEVLPSLAPCEPQP